MRDPNKVRAKARARKKRRVRKKIAGTPERPRLVVYRSLSHIYAQVVDDLAGRVVAQSSSLSKDLAKEIENADGRRKVAEIVGRDVARRSKKNGIDRVVFDRNGYLYHGRVRAVADGAREGGLEF